MIVFHLFTYWGDGYILPYTLRALTQSMEGCDVDYKIVIIDDEHKPVSDFHRGQVLSEFSGIKWRTSSFDRQGNLNGDACIRGMIGEYYKSYLQYGDEAVYMKLDCDTLILCAESIALFIDEHDCGCLGSDDRGALYGMFYGMRGDVLEELYSGLDKARFPSNAQEDLYIGYRIKKINQMHYDYFFQFQLWSPVEDELTGNSPEGIVTAYNWDKHPHSLEHYHKMAIVTLGNRRPATIGEDQVIAVAQQLINL